MYYQNKLKQTSKSKFKNNIKMTDEVKENEDYCDNILSKVTYKDIKRNTALGIAVGGSAVLLRVLITKKEN